MSVVFRFIWISANPKVLALASHKKWEVLLAGVLQKLLYGLFLLIGVSGYFISTAKGKGVEFFKLFEVKVLPLTLDEGRADLIISLEGIKK